MKREDINKLIIKNHDLIYEAFDLSSTLWITITIQNNTAMITNSNKGIWGEACELTEIGSKIAETIMLSGLFIKKLNWGSFTENKSLLPTESIYELNDDDIYFDKDLVKLWTFARTICNMEREKDIIYEVVFYEGSCYYCDYSIEQYKILVDNYEMDLKEGGII